jgi:hypothetical protein
VLSHGHHDRSGGLAGFHLAPHPADDQRQTALATKELNPDYLIPLHRGGETFIAIAMQEMGANVIRSSTATRFVFGVQTNRSALAADPPSPCAAPARQ